MSKVRSAWDRRGLWCLVALLLVPSGWAATPATGQQRRQSEPVLALRRVLTVQDPAAREQGLKTRGAALILPSDLRDALGLLEWRDNAAGGFADPRLVSVDQKARAALATKLRGELRGFLRSGKFEVQLAAIRMIGEMGTTVRGETAGQTFASTLAPDLQTLMLQSRDQRLVAAAAQALGQVYPRQDPARAAADFGKLLQSNNLQVRRGAARGLFDMAHTALQFIKTPTITSERMTTMLTPEDVIHIDAEVVRVAAGGLQDADADIRFHCLAAIRDAIETVTQEIPPPRAGEVRSPTIFLAVIQAVNQQALVIGRALNDPRPDIRELAARTLVDLSVLRRNLIFGSPRQPVAPPAPRQGPTVGPRVSLPHSAQVVASDTATAITLVQDNGLPAPRPVETTSAGVVLDTFRKLFPAMHGALRDPNFQVRLNTVEAIEMLAAEGTSFVPDLARAMHDPNQFVRWAAARTLGEMGPLPTDINGNAASVAGFLHLVANPTEDVDVRMAAATALERWGPDAIDASVVGAAAPQVVAVLSRQLNSGDPEVRIGILQTLEATRTPAPEAIQAIIGQLASPDKRVRVEAAAALGILANDAPAVMSALSRAVNDPDEEVRREASAALLDIAQRAKR